MAKAYVKHDYAVTGRDYVETEGGDTPAGGINYSAEEQDTGLKWLDGKAIYQKTIIYDTAVAANATVTLTLADYDITDIDNIIDIRGISFDGIPVNCRWSQGYNWGVTTFADGPTRIKIVTGVDRTFTGFWITLQYTKTE